MISISKVIRRGGIIMMALAIMVLSACSADELKAADIYEKTVKASANIESMTADMNIEASLGQGMDISSNISMDAVLKPELAIHETIGFEMMGQSSSMEAYVMNDAIYLLEPTSNQWIKSTDDLTSQFAGVKDQMDPSMQLEKLKPYLDDLTMMEEGTKYHIHFNASGDKMKEFITEELDEGTQQLLGIEDGDLSSLNIQSIGIVYVINKETFLPEEMNMTLELSAGEAEQAEAIAIKTNIAFSNYNSIPEIKLPAEALEAE